MAYEYVDGLGGWLALFAVQASPLGWRHATRDEIAVICKRLGWQLEEFDSSAGWALVNGDDIDEQYANEGSIEIDAGDFRVEIP